MFQIKYEYCVAGGGFVSAAPLKFMRIRKRRYFVESIEPTLPIGAVPGTLGSSNQKFPVVLVVAEKIPFVKEMLLKFAGGESTPKVNHPRSVHWLISHGSWNASVA